MLVENRRDEGKIEGERHWNRLEAIHRSYAQEISPCQRRRRWESLCHVHEPSGNSLRRTVLSINSIVQEWRKQYKVNDILKDGKKDNENIEKLEAYWPGTAPRTTYLQKNAHPLNRCNPQGRQGRFATLHREAWTCRCKGARHRSSNGQADSLPDLYAREGHQTVRN